MGLGDAKLLSAIGFWFGWASIPIVIFFSSLIAIIYVTPSLIKKSRNLSAEIPFGPYLIIGCVVFIIFGSLIGERIGEVENYSYTDYIFPGLLLMSVITHSYTNTVSSLYISKYHRYIEELLVSPIENYTILIGFITGGVIRGLAVGIVVILVAQFFVNFKISYIPITLLIIIFSIELIISSSEFEFS